MNRNQALIHYRLAMVIFMKWHKQGIINEEELSKMDKLIAGKYNLPPGSIYR